MGTFCLDSPVRLLAGSCTSEVTITRALVEPCTAVPAQFAVPSALSVLAGPPVRLDGTFLTFQSVTRWKH